MPTRLQASRQHHFDCHHPHLPRKPVFKVVVFCFTVALRPLAWKPERRRRVGTSRFPAFKAVLTCRSVRACTGQVRLRVRFMTRPKSTSRTMSA